MELTSNRGVENAAIAWVIELERAAGRDPRDTRGTGAAGDVSSPPRTIEVKAYGMSARGEDLWLEPTQVEHALVDPEFYVYVVDNVRRGDPDHFELRVLGSEVLRGLLERRREHRYFTVPWPVAAYDSLEAGLRE